MNIRRNFVLIVTQITLLRAQDVPTIDAISEDITGRKFDGAVKKIKERGDLQSTMNSVIFRLNNYNNEGVFNLFLQFLDYNREDFNADDLEISVATYRAVYIDIDMNNPEDRVKKLKLIKSFNSHLYFQSNFQTLKEARKFRDELHNSVSNIVLKELKDAMRTNNNDTLSTICEDIYKYYPELFKQVFEPALSQVFNDINVEDLIKFFLKHKYAAQNIYAFLAMFDELKKGNLNQTLVVDLAFGLKEAENAIRDAGDDLDSEAERKLIKVKNDLPKSVRNLAFSERICIKNTNKNEYLYAASDGFNYDNERRSVFTWIPGHKITQGVWFIVRNDNVYLIKNQNHTDECMFSSDYRANSYTSSKLVFTWIPKDTAIYLKCNWKFEPFGDDVYIINARNDEYLYVTTISKNDNDRRYVRSRFDKTKDKYSTWTVEDCSYMD